MADPFKDLNTHLESPARFHFEITAADEDLPIVPRALYVLTNGELVIRDAAGNDVTYPVEFGQVLQIRAVQVRAASTATAVGWY